MNPIVLIPARMAASRLPGKPLAEIGGVAMIVRAWRQAQAAGIGPVAVAAGDEVILQAVRAAGGDAVLTDPDLPSGSDRILAALEALDPDGAHDVVVNLQGDMPFIDPTALLACVDLLGDQADCDISTLVSATAVAAELADPNLVKAILAMDPEQRRGRALYFTRSTLYGDGPGWWHHGLYAYRRPALVRFCAAPPSPLERRERLEQLRALELGLSIWAAVTAEAPISVDTPVQLEAARRHVANLRKEP
jgi:3-deoxy-manno-octulosonate cytidylyltransferase (CMP-KDO synthetase)